MEVNKEVAMTIENAYRASKPIAALCISPILLAAVFKNQSPQLTLGAYGDDAKNLEKIGGQHQVTQPEEVIVDEKLKLVTGPCTQLTVGGATGMIFS